MTFDDVAAAVRPVDERAARAAAEHHDHLTKPRGALGRLEDAGIRLSAIAGAVPPPVPAPATVAVFAGDHGVLDEGVSPWPREVTAQMVANFCAGGAAINVLARAADARVVVVDVGVATPIPASAPGLVARRVRRGTGNIAVEPAMTADECTAALDIGAAIADEAIAQGAAALITGDMGIGNTTPSAALIAGLTSRTPADVTGRGTGIDDATLARKVRVVERALARARAAREHTDPRALLASVGGLEIAALTGFIVAGAAAAVPVIVDGVIAAAAALVAAAITPDAVGYLFAGHLSAEPGARAALHHLGLEPLLDLNLRLGEGSGAVLALPLLQAAARILREMATFDSAGITSKQ